MEHAGYHLRYPESKFSNINNTTSKLQPLDLGTIQKFKVHYKHLLGYVLTKMNVKRHLR